MGRRLERALNLAELLLALFGEARREDEETARLFLCFECRRQHHHVPAALSVRAGLSLVLDLLMVDEANPRGIGFQLCAIDDHLHALPQASPHAPHNEEQRLILDLLSPRAPRQGYKS